MICELQKIVLKRKIYVEHVTRKGEIRSGEIMVEKKQHQKVSLGEISVSRER